MDNLTNDTMQPQGSLMWFIDRLNENHAKLKKSVVDEQQEEKLASNMKLSQKRMNVSSKELEEQYFVSWRVDELAWMIVGYAQDNWVTLTWNSADIVRNYVIWNKNKNPNVVDDFAEFTHTTWNKKDFADHMWWTWEPSSMDEIIDWLGSVLNNMTRPERTAGQWIRDLYSSFQGWSLWYNTEVLSKWKSKEERQAIQDYAAEKYGKWLSQLTEEDWKNVEWDVEHNPELLEEYKKRYTPLNWVIETGVWWLATIGSLTPYWFLINLLISAWLETPYAKDLIWIFWEWLDKFWGLVSAPLKLLDQSWEFDNLPDETKAMVNQTISWVLLHKLLMWENKVTWKTEMRPWVRETLNTITPKFIRNIVNKLSKNKDPELKQIEKEYNIDKEKMDYAWKLADLDAQETDNTYESIVNSLERIPEKSRWMETTDDIITQIDNLSERINKMEDKLYEYDTRTYGPENDYLKIWWAEFKPIADWIEILRKIYADDKVTLAAIDDLEQMYLAWKVTNWMKNTMARAIADWFEAYSARDVLKSWELAWTVEQARRVLKESARGPYEWMVPWFKNALEYLDSAWHDAIVARNRFLKSRWKYKAAKNDEPVTSKWKKIANKVTELWADTYNAVKTKWVSLAWKLSNRLSKNKSYDPLSREWDIGSLLKIFYAADKKLWRTNYETKIEDWLKNMAEMEEDVPVENTTTLEWEVIEPEWTRHSNRNIYDSNKYLEDIVEQVEAWKKMEYNEWYNWDPSVTIRVTPEWYAWRQWQIIESYKVMEEIWLNENEITDIMKKWWVSEKEIKAVQQSLFWEWEIPEWKRTDFLWRKKWVKRKK